MERFTCSPFIKLKMGTQVERGNIAQDECGLNVHGQPFDFVLNCTYNQAVPLQLENHQAYYDLCISVIVAERPISATKEMAVSFGIFDGPFPSLEPYDFAGKLPQELEKFEGQNLFQIFDVKLSSIGCCLDPHVAYALMADWEKKKQEGSKDYNDVVTSIWDKCESFFPRLKTDFELAGTWFALKTKVQDESASRPLVVLSDESVDGKEGRFIQVFSSKLTSIFDAEEGVLNIIETKAQASPVEARENPPDTWKNQVLGMFGAHE